MAPGPARFIPAVTTRRQGARKAAWVRTSLRPLSSRYLPGANSDRALASKPRLRSLPFIFLLICPVSLGDCRVFPPRLFHLLSGADQFFTPPSRLTPPRVARADAAAAGHAFPGHRKSLSEGQTPAGAPWQPGSRKLPTMLCTSVPLIQSVFIYVAIY